MIIQAQVHLVAQIQSPIGLRLRFLYRVMTYSWSSSSCKKAKWGHKRSWKGQNPIFTNKCLQFKQACLLFIIGFLVKTWGHVGSFSGQTRSHEVIRLTLNGFKLHLHKFFYKCNFYLIYKIFKSSFFLHAGFIIKFSSLGEEFWELKIEVDKPTDEMAKIIIDFHSFEIVFKLMLAR